MATDLDDLRAKLAELRAIDTSRLRERVALFTACADLDDASKRIAEATDTDPEVALLVTRSAWTALIHSGLVGEVTPEEFAARVELGATKILHVLADGGDSLDDPLLHEALQRTIRLGRQGVKITPVKDVLLSAASIVPSP